VGSSPGQPPALARVHIGALIATVLAALALALPSAAAAGTSVYSQWPWSKSRVFHGPFNLPMAGVQGLGASPDGAVVYVGTGGVVIRYSASGVWLDTWSARFGAIAGLAVDPAGEVLVADSKSGTVQKFDPSGKQLASWSVPGVRGLAADAHGDMFLLVSVGIGEVVDVRSYFSGADKGAWPALLPGTWFNYYGYGPSSTASVSTVAADAAGHAYLVGSSVQHLEGEGPDCHGVFEANHALRFEFDDPNYQTDVAEYTASGDLIAHGFATLADPTCYPPWGSSELSIKSGAAIAADGTIWVGDRTPYAYRMSPPSSYGYLNETENVYSPCYTCEGHLERVNFYGPGTFDCQGDMLFGGETAVLEMLGLGAADCPKPISAAERIALAPMITISPPSGSAKEEGESKKEKGKKKEKGGKKKGKLVLGFEAGCLGGPCTVAASIRIRSPRCHCLVKLASGRFTLAAGAARVLSLVPPRSLDGLLRGRPKVLLSARMLRHGKPFGPTFKAAGGRALTALEPTKLTLTCPGTATPGSTITVTGSLGFVGAHNVSVSVDGSGARLLTTGPAGFTFTVPAGGVGLRHVGVSFAGEGAHGPAGAECSTAVQLPAVSVPPLPAGLSLTPGPKPAPPGEPAPTPTSLTLKCPSVGSVAFTGTLAPPLKEAAITIAYGYSPPAGGHLEKVDVVHTAADGSFSDEEGPPGGDHGEATASFAGGGGYAASSSTPCSF